MNGIFKGLWYYKEKFYLFPDWLIEYYFAFPHTIIIDVCYRGIIFNSLIEYNNFLTEA